MRLSPVTGRLSPVVLAWLLAGCNQSAPDLSAAAVDAVKAADSAWEKAFSGKDLEGAVAAVESGGSILPANAPIATGPDAIRALFSGFYALPDLSLHWQASRAEAAHSGELAYTSGSYSMTFTGPKGPVTDHGKYATVWRKQADGTWKVVVDVFNSDSPVPGS